MTESEGEASVIPDVQISSTGNRRVKEASKLGMKKHRLRQSKILIEGIRTVDSAVRSNAEFDALFCLPNFVFDPDNQDLLRRVKELGGEILEVTPEIIERISMLSSPQGIIATVKYPHHTFESVINCAKIMSTSNDRRVFLWFDRISDPTNLGTIIRSAHCLGACGFFTSPGSVEVFNPRSIRASAGSVFFLPGAEGVSLNEMTSFLPSHSYQLIASAPRDGILLDKFTPDDRCVLLIGEEGEGLSEETINIADTRLTIPMAPDAESLNVAAASAIILHRLSPLR